MRTYKTLERTSRVLGISLTEMGLLLLAMLTLFVLSALVQFFVAVSGWIHMGFMGLILGLYVILKRIGRGKQPGYLLSWTSFHFYQAKEIRTYDFEKDQTPD